MGEVKDWLFLIGKSILVLVGMVLFVAGLVDLVVGGWNLTGALALAAGLVLGVPPMALAFRDALREAKKGRI